ncbi:hypothetical protein OGAPHI_000667 [Ogataea philodendri]|uniref:Uncharacterized protein n=1 Tax=Ogataea philodendri TaxID=1378263 RepID=A0A9P8TAC1_9ASCO|nr:uncharacterized protein OGAPHI_000667 [Ogataea philodendri]KAH3670956.1 hypothetical protein OGAPHI_000667 [Ogataea philodendri]
MLTPRVQLQSRDLCGGSVFHEVVDWDTSQTSEPALHIVETNVNICTDTLHGDLTARDLCVHQVSFRDLVVLLHVELVRSRHVFLKDRQSSRQQARVSDPGTVVASKNLSEFVLLDGFHSHCVSFWVVLDRNGCSHSSHCVDTSLVADLDELLDVVGHERYLHGDLVSVWQDVVLLVSESLDGLDKNGGLDGSSWDLKTVLCNAEDVVPQLGLFVVFHLWQVEERSQSLGKQVLGVMEEKETEIHDGGRDWLAVNEDVLVDHVPSSWSDDQDRQSSSFLVDLVTLTGGLIGEVDLVSDSVVQVDLAVDHIAPCWRARVLEVGHVGEHVCVESIHNHLCVWRTGDLDLTALQFRMRRQTLPVRIVSDVFRLFQEMELFASVQFLLNLLSVLE